MDPVLEITVVEKCNALLCTNSCTYTVIFHRFCGGGEEMESIFERYIINPKVIEKFCGGVDTMRVQFGDIRSHETIWYTSVACVT
jgi:hypothetical protein